MAYQDRSSSRAPYRTGKEEDHEAWAEKTYAWAVGQDIADELFGNLDPHAYPQRLADETVTNEDDPRGVW